MSFQIITTNNIKALKKNSINKKSVWIRAKGGHIMVNVDASFNSENLMGEIGTVMRDDHEHFYQCM
jgi:hypothetical protein